MLDEHSDNVRLTERVRNLEAEIAKVRGEKEIVEMELKDSRRGLERFQLISDFAHDWEMWYNPDSSIEYVSPSFQNITGYAPLELISNQTLINSILFPEDRESYFKFVDDSVNFVSIRQSFKFRILTRTKQVRWCEIKCKAVYDKRGKYLGQRASIGDITSLMEALGQIKNLSEGKQYETRAKQKYMRDLESKDRELVSFLMVISQKNETLQFAKRQVEQLLKDCNPKQRGALSSIRDQVRLSLQSAESWDSFRVQFESINPGFFERISKKFPALTPKDLKICGYLKLGLSTKEIAVLQSITFQSAEISRVRLRKKLELTRDINLVEFIKEI